MRTPSTVGIVANPASGRDIRRLVSQASVFPTAEKSSMVQRLLGALGALGVDRALLMPDLTGICAGVHRARQRLAASPGVAWPELQVLDTPLEESVRDTVAAVERMLAEGAAVIVVLGGDGTHRAVAAHCGDVPIATLSSGTNNVFPDLREATVTGLAAGLVARGRVPPDVALRRHKRLRIATRFSDAREEIALVDACVSTLAHIGARALWQPDTLRELAVTFAEPDAIGLSAVAGLLRPVRRDEPHGLYLRLAPPRSPEARATVMAPIAPGLVREVGVASVDVLEPGRPRTLETAAGTLALDGEREVEFGQADRPTLALDLRGPLTVDVPATLAWAARHGALRAGATAPGNGSRGDEEPLFT
ncbi:MAG TPA: NAD(+)/NADH kinase [Anaeromyxobacteraceae bacterium]|nr:NAD(+)/NADH kinase [Anaeromyxobacteraceae bacterium]